MEQKDESYYVEHILDGETEYFLVFLDRYSCPLYTLIVQVVGCPENAEELLQDTLLKAFRNLNRHKGECRLSTWIYRIAYNAAISATRKKKQEFLYIGENMVDNVPDEIVNNVLAPVETEEQLECLEMAIDQLSGKEKALITLFCYEEKSMEEIDEVLKLSISNVKARLHRIRKKICVLVNNKQKRGCGRGKKDKREYGQYAEASIGTGANETTVLQFSVSDDGACSSGG